MFIALNDWLSLTLFFCTKMSTFSFPKRNCCQIMKQEQNIFNLLMLTCNRGNKMSICQMNFLFYIFTTHKKISHSFILVCRDCPSHLLLQIFTRRNKKKENSFLIQNRYTNMYFLEKEKTFLICRKMVNSEINN